MLKPVITTKSSRSTAAGHEAPHHGYGPDQRNGPAYPPRVAPLGDPVEMTVRGYELSLRKGDAEIVEIKEV